MTQLPLISVIIPVYKVENYLDCCVQSIVNQTYSNLEILLIDDGSPDASGAMCDAWAEKDSRIRVIHQENAGGGAARNAGLDAARGEIISMIDSDDYLSPRMYAYLASLMTEDVDIAECTIVQTDSDDCTFDEEGGAQVTYASAVEAMGLHIRDEVFCQTPPNKLYRRETIGDIRFPVGKLIDDEFFTYRVIGRARRLAHSSARMYAYRQSPESAMHRPFSLGRLHGLEAKRLRLNYLRDAMPELTREAEYDLFFSCIYGMQGSLKSLHGEELEQAREIIGGVLSDIVPLRENPEIGIKKRFLVKLAQKHFEGTCRMLNFLIDIHVLS